MRNALSGGLSRAAQPPAEGGAGGEARGEEGGGSGERGEEEEDASGDGGGVVRGEASSGTAKGLTPGWLLRALPAPARRKADGSGLATGQRCDSVAASKRGTRTVSSAAALLPAVAGRAVRAGPPGARPAATRAVLSKGCAGQGGREAGSAAQRARQAEENARDS
jgi:hypothetical protein